MQAGHDVGAGVARCSRLPVLRGKERIMKVCNYNVRPEYDFKVIGRNLKKLRLANDMTVEEVREYMQLGTVQSIYKWERGDGLPQADSLIALMQLYGVSNIEMITEEGSELSSSGYWRYLRAKSLNFALSDRHRAAA